MTMTKILKEAFLQHTLHVCCFLMKNKLESAFRDDVVYPAHDMNRVITGFQTLKGWPFNRCFAHMQADSAQRVKRGLSYYNIVIAMLNLYFR